MSMMKRPLTVVVALLAALTMVLGVQGCSRAVDGMYLPTSALARSMSSSLKV